MPDLVNIQSRLFSYARNLCQNNVSYQDLVQDTNIKILEKNKSFINETDFIKWSYVILKRTFIDDIRKKKHFTDRIPDIAEEPKQVSFYVSKAIRSIERIKLRECMIMRYKFDMTYNEIANMLHINLESVKQRLHNGRKLIISEYERTTNA